MSISVHYVFFANVCILSLSGFFRHMMPRHIIIHGCIAGSVVAEMDYPILEKKENKVYGQSSKLVNKSCRIEKSLACNFFTEINQVLILVEVFFSLITLPYIKLT